MVIVSANVAAQVSGRVKRSWMIKGILVWRKNAGSIRCLPFVAGRHSAKLS